MFLWATRVCKRNTRTHAGANGARARRTHARAQEGRWNALPRQPNGNGRALQSAVTDSVSVQCQEQRALDALKYADL